MRRRPGVVIGIALAVLLGTVAAQAQTAPRFRVALGAAYFDGVGLAASTEVTATLTSAGGNVKGVCQAYTSPTGQFSCSWGQGGPFSLGLLPPAVSEPGDRLSVEQGGNSYACGPFSEVRLANLDPVTDRVVGVVVPRRAKVRITGMGNGRLTPTGYRTAPAFVKVAETDAGGAFDIDLTSAGNPIRNDAVFVGAVQGTFEVGVYASFPGLDIEKDSNYGFLTGIPGTTHLVRLYGPGGDVKGEMEVTLGTGGFLSAAAAQQRVSKAAIGRGSLGVFFFDDAAGRPVRILEGDVIAVGGVAAFAFRVPKLAPGMGASRFAVRTLANRSISFSGRIVTGPNSSTYYSGYGKADATGLYQYDTSPTAITPYSSCRFTVAVDGNYVSTQRTLAP